MSSESPFKKSSVTPLYVPFHTHRTPSYTLLHTRTHTHTHTLPHTVFDGFGKSYTQTGQLITAGYVFVMAFILLNIFVSIMCTKYVSTINLLTPLNASHL